MAKVAEVTALMKNIAAEEHMYTDEYDNIGLLVGRNDAEVKKVLCCLDASDAVIDEAIEKKAGLIISHHPVIYYPISRISDEDVIGKKLLKAAEHRISIYASHTNLDFVSDGINEYLAKLYGLIDILPLKPYISETEGYGRVGKLPGKLTCLQLKKETEKLLNDKFVRVIGDPQRSVSRVAVINGGGGGDVAYVDMAKKAGAECLITADVKHHVAVYALDGGMTVIEPQHYTMEHIYLARLVQTLKIEAKSKKADIEILQAERDVSPRA
ncbi:MAG: Nif3-like dinuclear metal center hexameric protein [Clostridiales bacterium]|jgi:dinuclear metal center YbgI/SA1388 family protein|nr:Nif3-like dinuclear metal center hexameric protein [Clostridiales bacterium]